MPENDGAGRIDFPGTSTNAAPKARRILAIGEIYSDTGFSQLAIVWTDDCEIYLTNSSCRLLTFRNDALSEAEGQLIPKEDVYPAWRTNITEVQRPLPSNMYLKMQYRHCLQGKNEFELINAEIDILENLSKKSHPNIVRYYGCVRDGEYMIGICVQKYCCTLMELVTGETLLDNRPPFDIETILSGIKAGLNFLHSLHLVHDDINPANIMLDDEGHAVIIDFDSCTRVGQKSRGGTPGWSTNPAFAQFENDDYGLDLVTKFVRGEYDGQDFEAFGM